MPATVTDPTTTLPGGGQVAFGQGDIAAATAQVGATAGAPVAATQPNEILGSQSFDLNTTINSQTGGQVGGPGLWTVATSRGTATFNDMAKRLYSLAPADVEKLQRALYEGGYYDDQTYSQHANPKWGMADAETQQAFYNALLDASRHPDQNLEARIEAGATLNKDRIAQLQTGGKIVDLQPSVVSLSKINLSDPATLRTLANAASQALTGKDMTDEERQAFANNIQGQQRAQGQRAQADQRTAAETSAQVEREHALSAAAGPKAAPAELDAFKNVITNEIVGPISAFAAGPAYGALQAKLNQYGISAETMAQWADEARKAGVPLPSLSSPQAVDMVVDNHIKTLYARTGGDWASVATWFLSDVDASMKASRGGGAFGPASGLTPGPGSPQGIAIAEAKRGAVLASGSANLGSGSIFGTGPGTPAGQVAHDRAQEAATGLATADMSFPGGASTAPVGATNLQPLAAHVTTSMGQILGRAPGGAGGVQTTGDNTPIFVGGGEQTAIDPNAQAQEQIKREHPEQVFEHSMMGVLHSLDDLLTGRR